MRPRAWQLLGRACTRTAATSLAARPPRRDWRSRPGTGRAACPPDADPGERPVPRRAGWRNRPAAPRRRSTTDNPMALYRPIARPRRRMARSAGSTTARSMRGEPPCSPRSGATRRPCPTASASSPSSAAARAARRGPRSRRPGRGGGAADPRDRGRPLRGPPLPGPVRRVARGPRPRLRARPRGDAPSRAIHPGRPFLRPGQPPPHARPARRGRDPTRRRPGRHRRRRPDRPLRHAGGVLSPRSGDSAAKRSGASRRSTTDPPGSPRIAVLARASSVASAGLLALGELDRAVDY